MLVVCCQICHTCLTSTQMGQCYGFFSLLQCFRTDPYMPFCWLDNFIVTNSAFCSFFAVTPMEEHYPCTRRWHPRHRIELYRCGYGVDLWSILTHKGGSKRQLAQALLLLVNEQQFLLRPLISWFLLVCKDRPSLLWHLGLPWALQFQVLRPDPVTICPHKSIIYVTDIFCCHIEGVLAVNHVPGLSDGM